MVQRRAALLDDRAGGRVLDDVDLASALAVCARDAVGSVLATTRLEQAVGTSLRAAGGDLWGYEEDGELVAICFAGANMVPVVPVDDPRTATRALDAFAGLARGRAGAARRSSARPTRCSACGAACGTSGPPRARCATTSPRW